MSSAPKPRKKDQVSAFFKDQPASSSTPHQLPASGNQNESAIPTSDKERTKERHLKAMSLLEDALKGRNEKWGNIEIPKLEGELENVNPGEFKEKLVNCTAGSESVMRFPSAHTR